MSPTFPWLDQRRRAGPGWHGRPRHGLTGLRSRLARGWFQASLLVALLSAGPALAADPGVAPRSFLETSWDVKDGLPDKSVNVVLQTQDGYLWLGTDKGLARFDGVRFQVFDTWNTKELHSDRISALCEDEHGILWIGTKGGGVTRYAQGAFSHAGLSSQFVSALGVDRQGQIWVGTSGGGLFAFRAGNFSGYSTSSGMPDLFVLAVGVSRDGTVWLGTRDAGWVKHSDGAFVRDPRAAQLQPAPVNAIFADDSCLWLGTAAGLVQLADDQVRTYTSRDGLPSDQVLAVTGDRQGTLWVGTKAGAVSMALGGRTAGAKLQVWLRGEAISACALDREGNVWFGTAGGGVKQLVPMRFASLSARDGLDHEVVSCVLEDHAGQMWFGTYGGLNRWANGALASFGVKDGLANPIVTALLQDAEDTLWIGTQQGMNRFQRGRLYACPEAEGWPHMSVWAFHQDRTGVLWIGTADGLFGRSPNQGVVRYSVDDGLPSNDIRALTEGPDGRLWIGTSHGLAFRRGARFTPLALPSGWLTRIILCLRADPDGLLWCGTLGGGLIRLQENVATAFTTQQGLPGNTIYHILDDGLGWLWLTSNRGVFTVRKLDLVRQARQEPRTIAPKVFSHADGLPSDECRGFAQPGGWRAHDGRLWFATSKGVAVIDPAHMATNRAPPPVVLEQVMADNERLPLIDPITIKPGHEKLEFHFVALSFAMPERVRFNYQLEGFDKHWTEAGGRRAAYYTHIPPGHYRYRVTACNSDGVWNEVGATVAVVVRPEFWQTAWFRLGALGLVGLGMLGIHRWRLARVRALERLRLRIARDLHDEVGSNLSSIVMLTQVTPQPAPAELGDIRRVALETIEALRDIVWFINPANDRLGDFVQRLRETARTMAHSLPYDFRVGPFPRDLELSLLFRQNVLPIFKEILNNAVQHAHANRLDIELEAAGGHFRIRVRDDGVGFVEAQVKLGNGLRNLRRRASELGGSLTVESEPGRGCAVTLTTRLP
jgi:ligand-binding sensor domain-containing protein